MIIRSLEEVKARGQFRERPGQWQSARYLLRADGVGFTLTRTRIAAGTCLEMEYKNHVEANLVISGTGSVIESATGITTPLGPGDTYTLDKNDRHRLQATTDMELVCVFAPALVGPETHDADGSYPIL